MSQPYILSSCVTSLQASLSLLQSSISILHDGVQDYPRLSRVLQTTRHFDLISESHLHAAQEQVRAEIQPEMERLLDKVGSYLDGLERKEKGLMARAELLEGRLGETSVGQETRLRRMMARRTTTTTTATARGTGGEDEREKLRVLGQRKERLAYAVERLSLQAQQRERQLRKSMAAQ